MTEFLNHVIAPVWSVLGTLVGTFGVLLGVLVTSWNSRKQIRMQFEQQALESRMARVMSLRRDVYLDVCVAMARATESLVLFADMSREHIELSRQLGADIAAIGKVQVVATSATLDALMVFSRALSTARATLNLARMPILGRQKLVESGTLPPGEQAALVAEQTRARRELAELALHWSREVALQIPGALVAIRRELDLPLDEAAYRSTFEQGWAHTEEQMRMLFEQLPEQRPPEQHS